MKKPIIAAVAIALLASISIAQTTAPAQQAVTDPIVIAAGDITVRQSEFESALQTLPAEYQSFAMGPGKKQFAEDYLRMKMLASQGMKSGVDKDPEVVAQMNLMRENLVAQAQLKKIEEGITVSDAELQKIYDTNKNEYEQVKARHILIAFKGSPAAQAGKKELTEDEAKAKAEDIRKQIAGGADFAELAKKESDDTASGARGGDLGAFGRNQMVPEFEKAAFDAKAGELTPVVRTQYGYHVIKVDEKTLTPFAEVKANLERTERQKKLRETLDEMKTASQATFNETYFAPPPTPAATPAADTMPATPAAAAPGTKAKNPEPAKKPDTKKSSAKKP